MNLKKEPQIKNLVPAGGSSLKKASQISSPKLATVRKHRSAIGQVLGLTITGSFRSESPRRGRHASTFTLHPRDVRLGWQSSRGL